MLTVVGPRCGCHNRVCIWRALGQHVIAIFAHSDLCVHCSQGQGNKNSLDVQQHMSWRRKPGVCVGRGWIYEKTGSWGSILQKGDGRGGWWSRCDMGMSVRRGIEGEESGTSKGWSRKHRYGKLRGDHIRPQCNATEYGTLHWLPFLWAWLKSFELFSKEKFRKKSQLTTVKRE